MRPTAAARWSWSRARGFSTRAESQWFARQGWTLVNMTGHPEAVLARELRLGYTCLALVTDLDAGVDAADSVSHEEVFRVFNASLPRLRSLLLAVVAALPTTAAPAATLAGGEHGRRRGPRRPAGRDDGAGADVRRR